MGNTFPVSIQDKEIHALLDTGAEKSCMSMDMFARLRLSINAGRTSRLRNASGKDKRTHGVTTVKFKMGNTIFTQEFIVCDNLVRPIIIRRDFTVNNYIGTIWTRQGTKQVTQDNRIVIEVEEPARGKTLLTTWKIAILLRHYAEFELECDKLEGKFEIKPEPFLQQKEPNLWMDSFVIYNVSEDKDKININEEKESHKQTASEGTDAEISERKINKTGDGQMNRETKSVYIPYCVFNLSYVNHSYIPKGRVIAFAEKEKDEGNKVFKVEEIKGKEEYRNWIPKNKGILPVPPESDIICSPAEVSKHRRVKLKSKPIEEDTTQKFNELCDCFPEIFLKNSEDIGKTNLITMDIDTGDHPPICQKPYTLALKHYEWVQKVVEQLERTGIITRSVSPWASPIVLVPKKSALDEPPRRRMCIDFQRLNALQLTVVKVDSKAKGNLTLHPLPKIDELYMKLSGVKIFSTLGLTS